MRGTHYTPADIPEGKVSTEPVLAPMFSREHIGVNTGGQTPGMVMDRALRHFQRERGQILPNLTHIVEDATKALGD
jgi:hypothetical protein